MGLCVRWCAAGAPTSSAVTVAERIQYEGYLRREEANAVIMGLVKAGATIREIMRRTGHSRGLVRKVLRGQRSDVFRLRESSLELHLQWLDEQWAAGQRNGTKLWRRLNKHGFRGCLDTPNALPEARGNTYVRAHDAARHLPGERSCTSSAVACCWRPHPSPL